MTERFILEYIPHRMKQLGFSNYHIRYRNLLVLGISSLVVEAYNELYFIIGDPDNILIESDYGVYDSSEFYNGENIYQHRGEIVITNTSEPNQRIKFIQVIIVD